VLSVRSALFSFYPNTERNIPLLAFSGKQSYDEPAMKAQFHGKPQF
jgi:hypothetical protein